MATAEQSPRIPAAFLEEERRSMGEWYFRQEYCGEFLDGQFSVFRGEDIDAAIRDDVPPLFSEAGGF